ncbi:MAG: putative sporulation protein YtxC [Firmicutes bacterium]|jgi:putative sporulation protein YtxC|nr:putative sporulation protein YtxC [Bacillota bacterium]MDH7496075.1 putative sporulation protein YtxC [Bacillota bacterium]
MELIAIGVQDHTNAVRDRLSSKVRMLCEKGIELDMTERSAGPLTFLCLNLRDASRGVPAGQRDLVRYHVASALADAIVFDVAKGFVARVVRRRYPYFDPSEQERIVACAAAALGGRGTDGKMGAETADRDRPEEPRALVRRRNEVLFKVLDYLDTASCIVLDGFVRFRLKGFVEELLESADAAVDDYMIEREYNEFIRLLKYFVDVQEPRIDEVHVVSRPGGLFRLLDRAGKVVDNDYLEGVSPDLVDIDVDYEDLLISALISVSPRKIVLHLGRSAGVTDTIQRLFEGRVSVCPGCRLCEGHQARAHVPASGRGDQN